MKKEPVIIIGMPRSGTSMLTSFLESLGLFVGNDKRGGNSEAWFFYRLNEWMLKCANASWDNPHNFNFIDSDLRADLVRVADFHLRSARRLNYIGWRGFYKYRDIKNLDFPWGWKDPRNTFTLDVWKEVFPKCKVLHIYRHPLDAAESARYGKEKNKERKKRNWKWTVREYLLLQINYQLSSRTGNINESLKLWEEYVTKAFSWNEVMGNNIFHVRYELLLEEPVIVMQKILNFLNLSVNSDEIIQVVKNIKPERRYPFLKNSKLISVYEKIRDNELVKKLGYHDING